MIGEKLCLAGSAYSPANRVCPEISFSIFPHSFIFLFVLLDLTRS